MLLDTESGRLEQLLASHGVPEMPPLVLAGCWDALSAMLIEQAGHETAFVGRGAVARAMLGERNAELATVGMMLAATSAIRDATGLSLCVDIGGGFGNAFNVARTATNIRTAGAEAVQLSDGIGSGDTLPAHRLTADMIGKLKALMDAVPEFVVVARTARDPGEKVEALVDRCSAYAEAGANLVALGDALSPREIAAIAAAAAQRFPLALETDKPIPANVPEGVILICQPNGLQLAIEKAGLAALSAAEFRSGAGVGAGRSTAA